MRIGDVRRANAEGWSHLTATAHWETRDAEPIDLVFTVPSDHQDFLTDVPDPFLVACSILAAISGEERIEVPGADPHLASGVRTALAWLNHWYPELVNAIAVETDGWIRPTVGRSTRVAGSLLSGGIDSLALLRDNQLNVPTDHPLRIEGCVLVNWNAGNKQIEVAAAYRAVERKRQELERFARRVGVTLVPLYSNVLALLDYPRAPLWGKVIHGLAFGGAAHALKGGFHSVFIGSSDGIPDLKPGQVSVDPWGSHPLVDGQLSSAHLQFVRAGDRYSRLQKTSLVASWPEALAVLSVCTGPYEIRAQKGNCGQCEKCLRTALAFAALGKLDEARTLALNDTLPQLIRGISLSQSVVAHWEGLRYGLQASGQVELASEVKRLLISQKRRQRLQPLITRAGNIDRRFLGGRARQLLSRSRWERQRE